jgi:hypothetical protein
VVKILADDVEKVARTTVGGRVESARVAKKASDGWGGARETVEPNVQFDECKGARVKERVDDINESLRACD